MRTEVIYLLVALLIAMVLHELAHGMVAYALGDDTAKRAGRLTLNPLKHLDQFGSIILPGLLFLMRSPFLFGWAKPVPVDPTQLRWHGLRHPRQLMALVAVAGPLMNFSLAILGGLLLWVVPAPEFLGDFIVLNLLIGIFNLIPMPPMDGGRIAVGLLPLPWARVLARTENFGILLVAGIIFVLPALLAQFGIRFDLFGAAMNRILPWALQQILFLTGHGYGS